MEAKSENVPSRSKKIEGRCGHYLPRKKRYCRMYATKTTFCVEHSDQAADETKNDRKRIPCPLNPKHSCYEDQLHHHVKKCNARENFDKEYMVKNINIGDIEEDTAAIYQNFSVNNATDDEFFGFIERLKTFYKGNPLNVETEILSHNIFKDELSNHLYGPTVIKHCKQQASLLGHLEKLSLLCNDTTFIEFGAGKGQLCHWIQKSFNELADNVQYLLVERSGIRYKKDVQHKTDNGDTIFERLRMDIAHLNLSKHPSVGNPGDRSLVAVSKHLCGPATDLSIRCFVNTLEKSEDCLLKRRQRALVIALCCHHRCSWKEYVGKQFFNSHGFSCTDFKIALTLSSWATCGFRDLLSDEHEPIDYSAHRCSRLTSKEKEEIGWQCKRLIDLGRVHFLQCAGFETNLKIYTEKDISLENLVLIAIEK